MLTVVIKEENEDDASKGVEIRQLIINLAV
jgi:hypothetical protein